MRLLALTLSLLAGASGLLGARRCTDAPGETCASCTYTAVTVSCTVKVAGHGCTVGNHINFGGWVICS